MSNENIMMITKIIDNLIKKPTEELVLIIFFLFFVCAFAIIIYFLIKNLIKKFKNNENKEKKVKTKENNTKQNIQGISTGVSNLNINMSDLNTNYSSLNNSVENLKEGYTELKNEIKEVKEETKEIKENVALLTKDLVYEKEIDKLLINLKTVQDHFRKKIYDETVKSAYIYKSNVYIEKVEEMYKNEGRDFYDLDYMQKVLDDLEAGYRDCEISLKDMLVEYNYEEFFKEHRLLFDIYKKDLEAIFFDTFNKKEVRIIDKSKQFLRYWSELFLNTIKKEEEGENESKK